jgi:O-antigen ligase
MVFAIPFSGIRPIEIGITVTPSQLLGAATLAAFLLLKILSKEGIRKTPFDNILLLFFVIVVSISFIKYPQVLSEGTFGMWGGPARNPTGRTFAQIIALGLMTSIYFLTINILTNKDRLRTAIKVLLLAAFIISIFGLYQFVGSFFGWPLIESTYRVPTGTIESSGDVWGVIRVASTVGEAKNLALFLLPIIFLLLPLIVFKEYPFRFKLISISMICSFLIVFVLTFARSGWILFVVSLLLGLGLIAKYSKKSKEKAKRVLKISLILLLSYLVSYGVFAAFGHDLNSLVTARWQTIQVGWEESIDSLKFKATLEQIPQHLLLGVGWGNATFYLPYFGQVEFSPNQFLNILFETGIIGLGIFLWFIIGSLIFVLKSLKKMQDISWKAITLSLLLSFSALLISLMYYSYWFNDPYLWIMLGMLKASARLSENKQMVIKVNESSF